MALTGKKRTFADAVLAGKSNKEAAVKAGYSVKTASAAGSRLAKDPDIVKYLADRRALREGGEGKEPESPPGSVLATALTYSDPKDFLTAVMNDHMTDTKFRVDAAKSMMPYVHYKLGEGGKKDRRQEEAKRAAGRFSAGAPPKLVAAGGKKV